MSDSRDDELRALLECSRRMQELAELGDWDALTRLQGEQRQRVEGFFASPVTEQDAPRVAAAIRELVETNDRIARLGGQARLACMGKITTFDKHRQAVKAYSSNMK